MSFFRFTTAATILLLATSAWAEPIYQPPGANLTYGNVSHGQRIHSTTSNPASAAAQIERGAGRATSGGAVSVTAGIEYGNIAELFDTIDELSKSFEPSDPGDPSDPGGGGDPTPENPREPINIGQIIDANFPNHAEVIGQVAKEVGRRAAILAVIAAEGHAKAFASVDAPFVVGTEVLGGAWTFGMNWSGTSRAIGLAEPIDFDFDQVLEDFKKDYDPSLTPDMQPRRYDVSGDVNLFVDPVTGNYGMNLSNDSLLLTKAAKTLELSLGYSWLAKKSDDGNLFIGVEGKFYDVALSRVSVRFGDITDSEELFDAIRNSDFEYDQGIGFDLGMLWAGPDYQFGATVANVNQPKFEYPDVDLSLYSNQNTIEFLQRDRTYTMERQLKLEGSYFTDSRKWTFNVGLDANAVADPVGDDFQWFTASAGYATDSWWLPGVRLGYRENLAGTKLRYLGVGATVFKILNIDIASTLDRVTINGKSLPESLIVSIGFDIGF